MELSQYIKIAVAIILNEQNELLTVRKQNSIYYQLPGGKIEGEERPVDTLLRELEEELGLKLNEDQFEFLTVHEAQAVNEYGKTVRGYVFKSKLPIIINDLQPKAELEEVKWVKESEVERVNLANLLKQVAIPIWLTA